MAGESYIEERKVPHLRDYCDYVYLGVDRIFRQGNVLVLLYVYAK